VSRDRLAAHLRTWRWEYAWGAFALANLAWMELLPNWVSIPFHFIWVSLTVLFGFRLWPDRLTWTLVSLVVVGTGIVLVQAWYLGMQSDELSEIPLMFAMFLAMLLHTHRRRSAIVALQRVSEQNERMLERERVFVQNASHTLRTPITVALAHAELVQRGVEHGPRSVGEDVEIIVDELGRLRRLTDRLLQLAAVDTELVQRVPTDLAELVTSTMRRWSPAPRAWRIGRTDDATVIGNRERLMVALDAVLENAIKVTDDGDPIEVSVIRREDTAVIEISDSGPGIAPELLGSVFERFATGGASPGAPSGFGLGLAIVASIVTGHGGTVTAQNRPEGGAAVSLVLPLAGERDRPAPDRPPAATDGTGRAVADPESRRLATLP
jgi:signal transduction histidine kinase